MNKNILIYSTISIVIILLGFLFYINTVENNPLFDDESNPCDNSHLTNYEQDGQFPLDKINMVTNWDKAKKIPTVNNVNEPTYIPKQYELKFLYYKYHKVHAYYGLISEEYDMNVICPRDYHVNGFVIEYGSKEPIIYSQLIKQTERVKILNSIQSD